MNKSLVALISKLQWQLAEIRQYLQENNEKKALLQSKLEELKNQIQQGYTTPSQINPEQEMARLNFIIKNQQSYENLLVEKKEIEWQGSQIKEREIRLKKELKMLDIYQEKQKEKDDRNESIFQQKENDELVLRRRKKE